MHHPCNILVLLGKHNTIEEIAQQIQNTGLTNEEGANMGQIMWANSIFISNSQACLIKIVQLHKENFFSCGSKWLEDSCSNHRTFQEWYVHILYVYSWSLLTLRGPDIH